MLSPGQWPGALHLWVSPYLILCPVPLIFLFSSRVALTHEVTLDIGFFILFPRMCDRNGGRRLRQWLIEQIDSSMYPGLIWENDEKSMFRIPWKHAGKQDYNQEVDASIFKVKTQLRERVAFSLVTVEMSRGVFLTC